MVGQEFLKKAVDEATTLTQEEVDQVKNFLTTIKVLGRFGKVVIWVIISLGAIAVAIQQIKDQWVG